MSIKASLSSDGMEEVYTPPTLKEMCLYKCLTNKEILTKEVEVDEATNGSEIGERFDCGDWRKFRLKEPIQRELVEALLDAGDEYLFMLTPKYAPVLAAIRMSQPEHLVKVHVNNTIDLDDYGLEFLLSGGNVKSLEIHGCSSLSSESLDAINQFGGKLEYQRIGDSFQVLPTPSEFEENSAILRTPDLKTFIISDIEFHGASTTKMNNYWRFLVLDFIRNLEDLQISMIDKFETLEFLEPAKSKLSSLTLSDCVVARNANAWESLFKLDKLRFLDLLGSSIEDALVGENVVQRLLTAMPNLTRLAVDPGLLKDIHVDTNRGQGSVAKRLEFLGVMEKDAAECEIKKVKLLANDVAYFGTVEGELRVLEYYSNQLHTGYIDSMLESLLKSLSLVTPTPPWKTVAVISLLMKTIKNHGVDNVPELFFPILKKLLTTDVAAKLGEVLLDQCIGAVSAFLTRWSGVYAVIEPGSGSIGDIIDIVRNLDGELCVDHYVTVVPAVMLFMAEDMRSYFLLQIGMENFQELMKKIAQLVEKVADRFPGEINELWGISSILDVMKKFKKVIVYDAKEDERIDLLEIFNSMIASLRKLCLNSSPRRKEFYFHGGLMIVMDFLTETIFGGLGLADRDSIALLEILNSILQDTMLSPLSTSRMFVPEALRIF